jgi:hypothetical protein
MPPRKRTFDEQIAKSDGCWLWTGTVLGNRYGRFYLGYFNGKAKNIGAHRYAWERANRPLLPGEVVRHRCDNPPCVRPDHLIVGSQGDNLRDAASKGRLRGAVHGKGVGHRFAKLTDEAIREIRGLVAGGMSQREVAERFGVHQSQISRIAGGRRWSHI